MGTTLSAVENLRGNVFLGDFFLQVAVGGGDDADVDFDGAVAADAFEFALLQDAEEFGLDGQVMSPISSRKSVPPLATFEAADFAVARRR